MNRIIAASLFSFLAVTAPAHAAVVELVDAVNLIYPFQGNLTGTFTFRLLGPPYSNGSFLDYFYAGEVSLNGMALTEITGSLPTGYDIFARPDGGGPLFVAVNVAHIPNLTYADFGAESGTVTILSIDGIATPLPAALPLLGTALAGLGGAGWLKKRRKVSRYHSA